MKRLVIEILLLFYWLPILFYEFIKLILTCVYVGVEWVVWEVFYFMAGIFGTVLALLVVGILGWVSLFSPTMADEWMIKLQDWSDDD